MNNGSNNSAPSLQLSSTPLIVGACLVGAGTIVGVTGMIVGGAAMFAATRQWFRELEVPPSQVVRQKWGQTKAATNAGATAWHHHNGIQHARA